MTPTMRAATSAKESNVMIADRLTGISMENSLSGLGSAQYTTNPIGFIDKCLEVVLLIDRLGSGRLLDVSPPGRSLPFAQQVVARGGVQRPSQRPLPARR